MPNMQYDVACQKAKKPYPVSMELSVPEAPNETWIDGTENKLGISLRSVRLRIVRTDTNKAIMDFGAQNFNGTFVLALDQFLNLQSLYDIHFDDVKIFNPGKMIKEAHDVW